jgi:DNA-binding GntR family transcriptional regulator
MKVRRGAYVTEVSSKDIADVYHLLSLLESDAVQLVADLRKVMKLNRHKSLFKQGRIEDSLAEHETVMQALLRRDGAAAAQAMRQHFRNGLAAAS